ncbi:hypothetical protein B4110_0345 [Parageobacillus toebii]|uniref:Uncharacterized protein n=1 Tax=Parageobacillus toebii TaxID=153151 RepID=A0A150N733_9BACL|nr:hypothetical protein B4110_0345 [Parageobacillus toebii]
MEDMLYHDNNPIKLKIDAHLCKIKRLAPSSVIPLTMFTG